MGPFWTYKTPLKKPGYTIDLKKRFLARNGRWTSKALLVPCRLCWTQIRYFWEIKNYLHSTAI